MLELQDGKRIFSGDTEMQGLERTASLATIALLFVVVGAVCSELNLDIADADVRIVYKNHRYDCPAGMASISLL